MPRLGEKHHCPQQTVNKYDTCDNTRDVVFGDIVEFRKN